MITTALIELAVRYFEAGWHPIPLPAGAKSPPPEGRTGGGGANLSRAEITATVWDGNIGLRMPADVVGIDVDAYRGGQDTLLELIARLGPLPASWISHSGRNDGSGVRVFRVPVGLQWVAGVGGIDIIQTNHRYLVAWPSTHPDGRAYGWADQTEDRFVEDGTVPEVEALPELPWPWIAELSRGRAVDLASPSQALDLEQLASFVAEHDRAERPEYVGAIVAHFTNRYRAGHSRHDTMTHCLMWAAEAARAGIIAFAPAINDLARAWAVAVADDPRRAELSSSIRTTEFAAMLRHAAGRALGHSDDEIARRREQMTGVKMNPGAIDGYQPNGHGGTNGLNRTLVQTSDELDVAPTPQLVRGWFPRAEVCVVAGKPAAGKGVVLADIIARGSRGLNMPNGDRLMKPFMSGVICLPGEDSIQEWARRLTVAEAALDRVLLTESAVNAQGEVRSIDTMTMDAAVEELARRGAELIVVDSLTGLSNSTGYDTNKGEVRGVLDRLSQLARLYDLTVVLLHHTRKAQGDPLDVLQGNTQIGAASRSVLVVVEERVEDGQEPDVRLFGVAKLNGSKRSVPVGFRTVGGWLKHPDGAPMRDDRGDIAYVPRVEWVKDRTFTQGELIAASNGTVLRERRNRSVDLDAKDILADGPMPSADYVKAMTEAGYTSEQARRCRERVAQTMQHDGRHWTYPAAMTVAEAKQAIVRAASDADIPESS